MMAIAPRTFPGLLAKGIVFLLLLVSMVFAAFPETTVAVSEKLGSRIPLDTTFRDEAGKPVRLAELVGMPTILVPVYYRCSNVCSAQQARLASALQSLQHKPGAEYRVISFSFDEEETPELAARSKHSYLSAMRSPFPADGWRFLTGDRDSIRRLTDAVGYGFQRERQEFAHPVVMIVVAGDGTIVRYLYGVSVLPKDLALAVAQARSGLAGTSIRKMMDFCFSYDPAGRGYIFNLLKVSATVVIVCSAAFLAYLLLGCTKRKSRISERR